MKNLSSKIAYAGILAAVLIAGKFVLSFLPNVEIVSALIILSATFLGFPVAFPAVIIFCLIDTLIYGFYPIVLVQYLFHFPLLCFIASIKKDPSLERCLTISVAFSLLFWIETPILNVIFRFSLFLPTLISGIPFMILQLASSIAAILALYRPVKLVSNKIN